jgi:hypothetical protein
MRRVRGILAALALLTGASAGVAAAASPPATPTPVPGARLDGSFLLAGRIRVSGFIRGEHTGQTLLRTWQFKAGCPSGPCQTVTLTRPRPRGFDTVVLQQAQPGYYVGQGFFYAPLRCSGRIYRPGERVPFKITVTVTTAVMRAGVLTAVRLYTTYVNPVRDNLTPCVAVLGHDSATYHGHIVASS